MEAERPDLDQETYGDPAHTFRRRSRPQPFEVHRATFPCSTFHHPTSFSHGHLDGPLDRVWDGPASLPGSSVADGCRHAASIAKATVQATGAAALIGESPSCGAQRPLRCRVHRRSVRNHGQHRQRCRFLQWEQLVARDESGKGVESEDSVTSRRCHGGDSRVELTVLGRPACAGAEAGGGAGAAAALARLAVSLCCGGRRRWVRECPAE